VTAVLITGASSGIGRSLAVRFARARHALVLVARDEAALNALATELRRDHGVKVDVFTCDLSDSAATAALPGRVAAAGLSVSILVNNAGFGIHGAFEGTAVADELRMVRVQLDALLVLTKAFLPPMLARGEGKILNVASVYSFAPVPFQSVYGACKMFMYAFSEALALETRDRGITVTTLAPGSTRTAFRTRAGVRAKTENKGMSADDVAEDGYRGLMAGKRVVVPGGWNRVFVRVCGLIPRGWVAPFVRRINGVRLGAHGGQ